MLISQAILPMTNENLFMSISDKLGKCAGNLYLEETRVKQFSPLCWCFCALSVKFSHFQVFRRSFSYVESQWILYDIRSERNTLPSLSHKQHYSVRQDYNGTVLYLCTTMQKRYKTAVGIQNCKSISVWVQLSSVFAALFLVMSNFSFICLSVFMCCLSDDKLPHFSSVLPS